MIKVLFLIHDLGQGGAEKVLVNLVNNMDHKKFDITVMTLFDVGENKQYLSNKIRYRSWCKHVFRGNSHLMKLFSPALLHKLIIKDDYDIEIAYLEGPAARVISGCNNPEVKKLAWIHSNISLEKLTKTSFRTKKETIACYSRFDRIICVSKTINNNFIEQLRLPVLHEVLYNTNESDKIIALSQESVETGLFSVNGIKLIGVGKLVENKGFDRVVRIIKRLKENGYETHYYILGEGPQRSLLEDYIKLNNLESSITLLGYQSNPYKYVKNADLFVCSSYSEGFSTAATEALIVGTPVCTVEVSGMKEMLGENNDYGVIVENSDEGLYKGIKRFFDEKSLLKHYSQMAEERGKMFNTERTVNAVEDLLIKILEEDKQQ